MVLSEAVPVVEVVLRPVRSTDEPRLRTLLAEPLVRLWNPAARPTELTVWWEPGADGGAERRFRTWAIASAEDDRFLGTVSVFGLDTEDREAKVGYRVLSSESGRGVATAALIAATNRAVRELDPSVIWLEHAVENPASCRVAQKAGYSAVRIQAGTETYGDGQLHQEHLHAFAPLHGPKGGHAGFAP